jgi:hypothetical protein
MQDAVEEDGVFPKPTDLLTVKYKGLKNCGIEFSLSGLDIGDTGTRKGVHGNSHIPLR